MCIYNLFNQWPKWQKNFLNITGEKFSGKSHLVNIFLKKFKGIKFEDKDLSDNHLKKVKIYLVAIFCNFVIFRKFAINRSQVGAMEKPRAQ